MKELIPMQEYNGKKAVSARLLHEFLESKQQFANWITNRIKKYGFVENQDYEVFNNLINNSDGGRPLIEYALTIPCAKEISMVEGNEKGRQARKYFIACEEELKKIAQTPQKQLSTLDMLELTIKGMRENHEELQEVKQEVREIQAKITTRPDFFTIAGFGSLIGINVNLKLASSYGQKASKLCKERDIAMDTIPDPRFGKVRMYPRSILEEVFNQSIN